MDHFINSSIAIGACVPSTCTVEDIQAICNTIWEVGSVKVYSDAAHRSYFIGHLCFRIYMTAIVVSTVVSFCYRLGILRYEPSPIIQSLSIIYNTGILFRSSGNELRHLKFINGIKCIIQLLASLVHLMMVRLIYSDLYPVFLPENFGFLHNTYNNAIFGINAVFGIRCDFI